MLLKNSISTSLLVGRRVTLCIGRPRYEGVHNHLDWRTVPVGPGNSRPVEQSAQAAPALISVANDLTSPHQAPSMIAGVGDEHLSLSHPAAKAKSSLEQTE